MALSEHLKKAGYDVVHLDRKRDVVPRYRQAIWDGKTVGDWAQELEGAAGVINLAGAPINQKWTDEAKRQIIDSRVQSTAAIRQAIVGCSNPPLAWINASAIGYYGDRGDEVITETSPHGPESDFLVESCLKWEAAVGDKLPNTVQAITRFGIVLSTKGGAFPVLFKLAKSFLGGAAGDGRQYISWVHIDDVCGLLHRIVDQRWSGVFNVTAPTPERNGEFMAKLRAAVHRPWSPPAPAFAFSILNVLGGPEPDMLLKGQQVMPARASELGYEFRHPTLESALAVLT